MGGVLRVTARLAKLLQLNVACQEYSIQHTCGIPVLLSRIPGYFYIVEY
jgi:hypothetical protein